MDLVWPASQYLPGYAVVDVGRRVLRLHRIQVATWHDGTAALLSRSCRLRRGAMEARPRISATRALRLLLPYARAEGLAHIDLTTTAENVASQRVIEANGGFLVERFQPPPAYGRDEGLRFRIVLTDRLG